jgi:hypothetical protein
LLFFVVDVSVDTAQKFLEFLYTGAIRLETREQVNNLKSCSFWSQSYDFGIYNFNDSPVVG